MKTYSNVKRLIYRAEKFDNQLEDGEQWDDKNFANWLTGEVNAGNKEESVLPEKPKTNIVVAIYFMNKYALFYSRKIFKNSKIYSIDDFSFLASLLPDKKLKKADVIRKNIAEKSSGNEVLKRLLRQKLIKETNNPNDKRSKLLEISPEGFTEINAVTSQMYNMGSLVDGDLTDQEKTSLLTLLSKLHEFHNPLFEANDEKLLQEKLGIKK
ncbi:hypothetical protein BH10BAC3_BH10BAC3_21970 [soil metagenome]